MSEQEIITENPNTSAVIAAECHPDLKEAFKRWYKNNGFASEAEAIRAYVRSVTNFKGNVKEK